MNQGDAVVKGRLYRVNANGLSVDQQLPRVWLLHAGQDLHQRAFAGSVFANQRQNFAVPERQVHMAECDDAWKPFRDITDLKQRVLWRLGHGWSYSNSNLMQKS